MSKETKAYVKELTATTTEQYLELPANFTKMAIINHGSVNVDINFDNNIADVTYEKLTIRPAIPYEIPVGTSILHYKSASGTAVLQVTGTKHERS